MWNEALIAVALRALRGSSKKVRAAPLGWAGMLRAMTTMDDTLCPARSSRSGTTALAVALFLAAAGGAQLAAPATAHADHDINTPFTGTRPFQLEFHGGFTWYGYGFAGGARFGIPIVHNGFIGTLDNAIYLNFGVDAYFVRFYGRCGAGGCFDQYAFALGIPVALHWEFYFSDNWSAFAEIGFQFFLPPSLWNYGDWEYGGPNGGWIGQWIIAGVGGSFHISDAFALTARLGNPYISFGVEFLF